uniref:Uncharacterized protein n=1 Tax=Arsenophonus endosymbiont of Trialeurodes vaporariorum TaxID=235567 RepID=A0A3B0M0U7_9GAMM
MKIKGIFYNEVKEKALKNPDVLAAYLIEQKKAEMQELLVKMKKRSGLTSSQIAKKMGG